MANKSDATVTRQPKKLLWFGVVAGLSFTVLGILEFVQLGDTYSKWRIAKEVILILLAFAWAVDSIVKLRAIKRGQR